MLGDDTRLVQMCGAHCLELREAGTYVLVAYERLETG